jgi:hypothetical protein
VGKVIFIKIHCTVYWNSVENGHCSPRLIALWIAHFAKLCGKSLIALWIAHFVGAWCAAASGTNTWCLSWLNVCWADQAHPWRLGCLALRASGSHPTWRHLALGLHWAWAMPVPHMGRPGAWVMALEPRGMGLALGPKLNGSYVRTQ